MRKKCKVEQDKTEQCLPLKPEMYVMTCKDIHKVKYANAFMPLDLKVTVNNVKKRCYE